MQCIVSIKGLEQNQERQVVTDFHRRFIDWKKIFFAIMQGVKFVIVALVMAICAARVRSEMSDEMKELIAMLHKTCVDESGAAEDLILGAGKGNFPEDPALKCYMKCILIQGAGMDDDGIIDVEAIIAMLPEDMQDEIPDTMRKCGTQTGSDICDTAFRTNKCWYDNSPTKYFLF